MKSVQRRWGWLVPPTAIALVLSIAGQAGAVQYDGWFVFDRNTNANSRLYWNYVDWDEPYQPLHQIYWKAGSGQTTNECNKWRRTGDKGGWLPAGSYVLKGMFDNYDGSLIKGRAFWFEDKVCNDGVTLRSELFIHTEETRSQTQSCPTSGDDPWCWEATWDFISNGCIKVEAPHNIGTAHWYYHNTGGDSRHGEYYGGVGLVVHD